MWFWKSRDRFSLEELKYLNEHLEKVTVINDSNKDFVVETLRSMAELIVWGDQHDPLFFDYFMEKQLMAHFLQILNDGNKISPVAVQLLQTLIIIIGNIKSKHAIYYLFSNEYMNNFITYPFDFRHEEVLAYYISFLRTISIKLDSNTVSFFIKTEEKQVVSFPLYTEAIKFFHHEEGMVRIAVRTLTLNVYNVNDEGIQNFVMGESVGDYFSDLVTFLRQQSINLGGLVAEATRAPQSAAAIGQLEAAIAEIGDLLFYCSDIMVSGVPGLNELMSKHILNLLVSPVLVPSLSPLSQSAATTGVIPLCSMYLLSRLLHIVKMRPMVNLMSAALLRNTQLASAVEPANGVNETSKAMMSEDVPSNTNQENERVHPSSPHNLEANSHEGSDENGSSPHEMETDEEEFFGIRSSRGMVGTLQSSNVDYQMFSPREELISHLLNNDDKLVLASLCVLVSLLQNTEVDDILLDALGILPWRKVDKHKIWQALMGSESEEEPQLFADPPVHLEEDLSLVFKSFNISDFVDFKDAKSNPDADGQVMSPGAKSSKHRQEVLDALMQLLSRRPPPCAEALWHAGWLIRQLSPLSENKLSSSRLSQLDYAYVAAREDIVKEVSDCWCDVIPTVLKEEWKVCTKALESPSLQRDSSFVLLPRTSDSLVDGDMSSSFVGERMRAAVKVFVALFQMRHLLCKGTIPECPPLSWPKESTEGELKRIGLTVPSVRVGAELNLREGNGMPCRVAFERGKEISVNLMLVHKERDASSWLILAEVMTGKQGYGVVRVISPLAGSKPRVDDDHPRWLHLRIRSPHWPSVDAGKLGSVGSRVRRLVDGRWTLAFADEDRCRNAASMVAQMIDVQKQLVKLVLAPIAADEGTQSPEGQVNENAAPPVS